MISFTAIISSVLFIIPMMSEAYSLSDTTIAKKMSTSSGYTTITVDGQSSMNMSPDQITIMFNVNGPPSDITSLIKNQGERYQNVTDSIKNAVGKDFDKIQIVQKSSNINVYQYGSYGSSYPNQYVAYMSFPVKTKIENFDELSKNLIESGFRIDSVSLIPVKEKKNKSENSTNDNAIIKIPFGSSSNIGCQTTKSCFMPQNITAGIGSQIMWINEDSAAHTVTSESSPNGPDGIFDSGLFNSGSTFSYVFDNEGVFPYLCLVHPWMTGVITITSDAARISPSETKPTGEYLVSINVGLETKPDTLQNTMKNYQEKMINLVTNLKKYGVTNDDIPTGNANINPSYYGPSIPSSYASYTQIMVKTDATQFNKVINAISKSGGNVENVFLSYSDSSLDAVRKDMTRKAIDDANNRVLEIIQPLGLEVKGIKSIKINTTHIPNPYGNIPYTNRGLIISQMDNNPFSSGNISINASVEFEVGK